MYFRDLKKNDTFILEIKNCKYAEYNGCYLVFHTVGSVRDFSLYEPTFRIKFAKQKPKKIDAQSLNELEWIITSISWFEERLFPIESKEREKIKKQEIYYPNEYGILNEYLFQYSCKSLPKDFEYVGNYELDLPSDEYIPWSIHNIRGAIPKFALDIIIDAYKNYNKRESTELYDYEYTKRQNEIAKEAYEGAVKLLELLNDLE
ncbi:MAG: hypothetical protein ACI4WW_05480 [Candidatus Coprovivens sp.]